MKFVVVLIFVIADMAFAVSFRSPIPSSQKNLSLKPEEKVLMDLAGCVKTTENSDSLRKCGQHLLSEDLSPFQVDRILAWFQKPLELNHPQPCSVEQKRKLSKVLVKKARFILCSSASMQSTANPFLFFLAEEKGTLRLFNIKEE